MTTEKQDKSSGSGWRKISSPEDLEKCVVTMLNKILMSSDPLEHAGRFASLANCWLNAKRLELESGEWQRVKERIELVERAQICERQPTKAGLRELDQNLERLKELAEVV